MSKDKEMRELLNSARGTDAERLIEAIDRQTAVQERIVEGLRQLHERMTNGRPIEVTQRTPRD